MTQVRRSSPGTEQEKAMSSEATKKCPECSGEMATIKLIDHAFMGDRQLDYAVGEAQRSTWTALFPVEGMVSPYMCADCGRITLYGRKKE